MNPILQKKRWRNALYCCATVNHLQKSGKFAIIIDDEWVPQSGRFYLVEGNRLVWRDKPDSNCSLGYFINDPKLANGLELSARQYRSQYFGNIKVIKINSIKKFKIRKRK